MQVKQLGITTSAPRRKRVYWGDKLSAQGREVVEGLRRRHIMQYGAFADGGYHTVDDIPQTRRGVLLELSRPQLYTVLLQAAQARVAKLSDELDTNGRIGVYETFVGAVRPRRGVKWGAIQSEEDVCWHPEGITVVRREGVHKWVQQHATVGRERAFAGVR